MEYARELDLSKYTSSILLLGPRMTGKTHLLEKIRAKAFFNLLDPEQEIKYKSNPKVFYEEISHLQKGDVIIIDEIQKVPALLNYVQIGIEKFGYKFLLSGSSARKLKRDGVNLLGARALLFYLHPLSYTEIGKDFKINQILQYGGLPKVLTLINDNKKEEAIKLLKTYRQLYLQLEIQQEAITRNLGNFTRFLDIATRYNAQQVVYQNIASSAQIPRSTVSNYFDILEDTLIGTRVWEYQKSEKDKSKPKLYFFDCGVVRAVQNRLSDPPTPHELGHLFETFIFVELKKIRDYLEKEHTFSYWNNGEEVDILIEKNRKIVMAIECKSSFIESKIKFDKFHKLNPNIPVYIASLTAERARKISDQVTILPWLEVLEKYKRLH